MFLTLIDSQTALITPNERLARFYQQRYTEDKKHTGHLVFEPPAIFSYDLWLKKMWRLNRIDSQTLLTPQQSHVIWENIVRADTVIVNEVKKAWKIVHEWRVPWPKDEYLNGTVDNAQFFEWAMQYRNKLAKHHWIDRDMLPATLENMARKKQCNTLSAQLILADFMYVSPALSSLLAQLYSPSALIFLNETHKKPATQIRKQAFLSENEEMQAFIEWTKGQGADQKIACVVPQLSRKRDRIERVLNRYFSPSDYDISAGHIFADCTMITQALSTLSLGIDKKWGDTTLPDVYFIIDSRYIGSWDPQETLLRDNIIKSLHDTQNAFLPFCVFFRLLQKKSLKLAGSLRDFKNAQREAKYLRQKPRRWVSVFQQLLTILGWPGSYTLDSVEYQTYQRWQLLLEEYQTLDLVCGAISFRKALKLLKTMARNSVFQVQKKQPKIQVLGILEALGMQVDALWVMGMHDDVMLASAVPVSSFIPQTLQQQYHVPQPHDPLTVQLAEKTRQYFLAGGENVMLSYLSRQDDVPVREPVFLKNITEYVHCDATVKIYNILETIHEPSFIPNLSTQSITGGVSLIENQDLCPFKAFGKHRLKTRNMESLSIGLSAQERGSLVHAALDYFWKKTQTQKNLLAYTEEQENSLLQAAADWALSQMSWYKSDGLTDFFRLIEHERLTMLLKKWLIFEKKRPAFEAVLLEEKKQLMLGELTLSIRLDRMDKLVADQTHVVIDYKTGSILPSLEKPQLYLYALLDPNIHAIALGHVNLAHPVLRSKTIDRSEEIPAWAVALETLAAAFVRGENPVAPQSAQVCRHCDLQGICRIREIK